MNCGNLTDAQLIECELSCVDLTAFLGATGVPYIYAQTKNGSGGRVETWTVSTPFACNVKQVKPVEQTRQGERKNDTSMGYQIECGTGVDLKVMDRIVVGPTTYEVRGVMERATLSFLNSYWCSIVAGF